VEDFAIAYPNDGDYHRIAFTYNPETLAVSLQIDNGSPTTGILSQALTQNSSSISYWFNLEGTAGSVLDEAAVWRGVLTAEQWEDDWNSGAASQCVSQILKVATESPLPSGTVGSGYDQQLSVVGELGSVTWTVLTGSIPDGMTLGADGRLTGAPTTAGSSTFEVQADDGVHLGTKSFELLVEAAAAGSLSVSDLYPGSWGYSNCYWDEGTCEISGVDSLILYFAVNTSGPEPAGEYPYAWSLTAAPAGAYLDDLGSPGGETIAVRGGKRERV
jgi:hypothetical protein